MKESRYYTPEIEEALQLIGNYPDESPISFDHSPVMYKEVRCVIDGYDSGLGFMVYDENCERHFEVFADDLRVKYLDREDIESLGWKFYQEEYTYKMNKWRLWFDPISNNVRIAYKLMSENELTKFKGIVKNKSELKRIMKQVGI